MPQTRLEHILKQLRSLSDPNAIEGMARFGITPENTYGISMPNLRKIAKDTGKDHNLAQELWDINNRETRKGWQKKAGKCLLKQQGMILYERYAGKSQDILREAQHGSAC